MKIVDSFIIDFRVYLLKSLCKYYRRSFNLDKIPREFYGEILKGIPHKFAEGISPKPKEWDLTNLADIYYERREEIFLYDLVNTEGKQPYGWEKKKMVQKWGEVKATLARVRHMRNKLAHQVKPVPSVKGIKAYNCAEAAYSFFK